MTVVSIYVKCGRCAKTKLALECDDGIYDVLMGAISWMNCDECGVVRYMEDGGIVLDSFYPVGVEEDE